MLPFGVTCCGREFPCLYNAAVVETARLIQSGAIGEVLYLYMQRLNLGQVRTDVNAWWNLAPHDVSILLHLLRGEMPDSISARGLAYLQPGIEDVVFAVLTFASGITAHIHVSWLDPEKVRRVTIVGSERMIVYDDTSDDKVAIHDRGVDRIPRLGERMDFDDFDRWTLRHRTGDIRLPRIAGQEPLRAEASHFLECIEQEKEPLTSQARNIVRILEAGQESLLHAGETIALAASPE